MIKVTDTITLLAQLILPRSLTRAHKRLLVDFIASAPSEHQSSAYGTVVQSLCVGEVIPTFSDTDSGVNYSRGV